jgi:RNA methyltransferase, TrmH family
MEIKDVTSAANPLLKLARSLELKKHRTETGLFLAEGARHAAEGLANGWRPRALIASPEAFERPQTRALAQDAARAGAEVVRAPERLIGQLARKDNPQSVIAVFRQHISALDDLDPRSARLWIALQSVRDPGNLGTVLRTADAIGAGGVILVDGGCDPFSVEAVRASMGSLFAVKLARCSFAELNAWRLAADAQLIGTSLKGAVRHDLAPLRAPVILLSGNEQSGLPDDMAGSCDALVKLPMAGRADSLNLAVATAVTAYDIWRRMDFGGAR